jgi:hypothetical protein
MHMGSPLILSPISPTVAQAVRQKLVERLVEVLYSTGSLERTALLVLALADIETGRLDATTVLALLGGKFAGLECQEQAPPVRPRWDRAASQLWVGPVLVKRVRRDAVHQRLVLDSFHEVGWQDYVDDPLPGGRGIDRKVRVRRTVEALNAGQRGGVRIRFHAGGAAQGFRWEIVPSVLDR